MKNDSTYVWCPECRKWVPADLMQYDDNVRVCTPCLEGTSDRNNYLLDEYHEQIQCIYCDGYNTKETLGSLWVCNDCGEIFRR